MYIRMHEIKKRVCFQERETSKHLILIFDIQKIRFLSHTEIIRVEICETKWKKIFENNSWCYNYKYVQHEYNKIHSADQSEKIGINIICIVNIISFFFFFFLKESSPKANFVLSIDTFKSILPIGWIYSQYLQ